MTPPQVFLFDIDGTLMRHTGPHHAEALICAIHEVLGITASIDGIPVHGMLDSDILRAMLLRAGLSAPDADRAIPRAMQIAQQHYPLACPDLSHCVLPGIAELLTEINTRHHPCGLVTGNLTTIGWTKIERAGLRRHFAFGAFAGMAPTRTDLARIALEMSGAAPAARVTLVGDAPSDVEAARANGFRMVAVATGLTPAGRLRDLGADIVLDDLSRPEDRTRVLHGA